MVALTAGQRVRVVEVLATWDAKHHRLGTTGTVTRAALARPRFFSDRLVVVRHDDGAEYAYAPRSLHPID